MKNLKSKMILNLVLITILCLNAPPLLEAGDGKKKAAAKVTITKIFNKMMRRAAREIVSNPDIPTSGATSAAAAAATASAPRVELLPGAEYLREQIKQNPNVMYWLRAWYEHRIYQTRDTDGDYDMNMEFLKNEIHRETVFLRMQRPPNVDEFDALFKIFAFPEYELTEREIRKLNAYSATNEVSLDEGIIFDDDNDDIEVEEE